MPPARSTEASSGAGGRIRTFVWSLEAPALPLSYTRILVWARDGNDQETPRRPVYSTNRPPSPTSEPATPAIRRS